jgi:hypothetical protein
MNGMVFKFPGLGALRWAFAFVLLLQCVTLTAHAQTGLTLRGDSVVGETGHEVTITFRTEGFWQITQGMGTVQWDPHVIDYAHAGDFGIGALSPGSFSLIPDEGMLTFQWSSSASLGNTLPDGSVLFSLTFGIHGTTGETTSVAFTNGWTALHFESVENINLPFSSVSGNVTVVPEPGTAALFGFGLMAGGLFRFARSHMRGSSTDATS